MSKTKHDEVMEYLDKIDTKLNFVFGYLSNNHLATEAIKGLEALVEKMGSVSDDEKAKIKEYAEILEKNHKENIKNVHDGIEYFMKLYGEDANKSVFEKMTKVMEKESDSDDGSIPQANPVADVKIKGSSTSEKV